MGFLTTKRKKVPKKNKVQLGGAYIDNQKHFVVAVAVVKTSTTLTKSQHKNL